jgi:AcrR family transcriptional regulator
MQQVSIIMTFINPKTDRRSLRTRKMLWEALIALIQEKDYAEITIQDIADKADVNRVTFYLHYRDKHDLLLNNIGLILDDLVAKIQPATGENFRTDVPPDGLTLAYQYVAENAKFYRIILGDKGIPVVVNRLRKYLTELSMQRLRLVQEGEPRIPMEIVVEYSAGAMIALINWWLENDMPISAEELAHQTLLLTAYGVYWGAGIQPPEIKP